MGCGKSKGDAYSSGPSGAPGTPQKESEVELSGAEPVGAADEAAEQEMIAKMKGKSRRQGVSSEPVKLDPNWVPPKYEKTDDERISLAGMIAANKDCQVLVGHLSRESMETVIDAFFKKVVAVGENLIKQGDDGDNFYIVHEGSFDIFVTRGSPPVTTKVMTAGPGICFGHLALMYNAPRAATCTASVESHVWALERDCFRQLLISDESTKKKEHEDFLEKVEVFQHLNNYERSKVCELLQAEDFEPNKVIIQQGDVGSAFFLLAKGTAKAFIAGDQGEIQVCTYDKAGAHFGEIALIKDNLKRQATVRSGDSGCRVLSLQKEDFDRVLGPLRDSMSEGIGKYPKYADLIK